MRKKRFRKALAMLTCSAMVLSLAACGQEGAGSSRETGGTEQSAAQEGTEAEGMAAEPGGDGEITTLTCYFQNGNNGVERYPWFEKYLGEKFGIFLESRAQSADSSLLAPMLASGELTDIIQIGERTDVINAVAGDMLLDLEEYKEQLPHIFGNEKYQSAIRYARDTFGGLYMMPLTIGESGWIGIDPQMRWDLYKTLGMPEIPDMDSLLDVLKQMQELEPETAEGLPVYGLGAFNDWDGNSMMTCAYNNYMVYMGYTMEGISWLTYIRSDGSGDLKYLLDDDSVYRDALQWFFRANQMGLLDPESATMNYEGYIAKAGNAQYLSTVWDWYSYGDPDAEEWWGHASVWPENAEIPVNSDMPVGSSNRYIGISSGCADVDKALAFLDWYYSEEGIDLLYNGPEGMLWEYDDSGKRILSDLYYENDYQGNPYQHPDGGNANNLLEFYYDIAAWPNATAEHGQKYELEADSYACVKHTKTRLQEDFIENNGGYINRYERAKAEGKNLIETSPVLSFVASAPDDIEAIRGQIGEIVVQNSWKMVYAKDQAEFDALWAQTQADAEALGAEQVFADAVARWEEAVKTSEKYLK